MTQHEENTPESVTKYRSEQFAEKRGPMTVLHIKGTADFKKGFHQLVGQHKGHHVMSEGDATHFRIPTTKLKKFTEDASKWGYVKGKHWGHGTMNPSQHEENTPESVTKYRSEQFGTHLAKHGYSPSYYHGHHTLYEHPAGHTVMFDPRGAAGGRWSHHHAEGASSAGVGHHTLQHHLGKIHKEEKAASQHAEKAPTSVSQHAEVVTEVVATGIQYGDYHVDETKAEELISTSHISQGAMAR